MPVVLNLFQNKLSGEGRERPQETDFMFTARTFDSGMDTSHEVPCRTVLTKRNERLGEESCITELAAKPRRGSGSL